MAKALRDAISLALMPVGLVLLGLIKIYQYLISPMFPPTCRFAPSCSTYAGEALRVHGPVRGLWLVLWRLARCNPWGGHGYDPVPKAACEHRRHAPLHASTDARGDGRPAAPEDRQRPIKGTS